MSLAIENFKFLAPLFPIALIAGGGLGAERTLDRLDKTVDTHCSLWNKAKSGIGVSVVSLSIYSSLRLLEIRTKNSGYSKLAALVLLANTIYASAGMIHLYKRINQDLHNFKDRIQPLAHNLAAVMISAAIGAMGLILFETISKTYLGHNLNAMYAAAAQDCKLCWLRKN